MDPAISAMFEPFSGSGVDDCDVDGVAEPDLVTVGAALVGVFVADGALAVSLMGTGVFRFRHVVSSDCSTLLIAVDPP
jgi:hypothetical protein